VTREATARFLADPRSAGHARRFAAAALDGWDLAVLRESVVLLVSELVSNAVLHADTPVAVRLVESGPRLRVEVSDGSPASPRMRHFSLDSATGRGLQLVDSLASDWGVEPRDEGKRVWFEVTAGENADPAPSSDMFDVESVEAL